MVCNEEEVLRICKKYGIETVEKEGYPIYRDKEMDENFSISDIMHEPVQCIFEDEIISSSNTIELSLPLSIRFYPQEYCNYYPSCQRNTIVYKNDSESKNVMSNIYYDNANKFAA